MFHSCMEKKLDIHSVVHLINAKVTFFQISYMLNKPLEIPCSYWKCVTFTISRFNLPKKIHLEMQFRNVLKENTKLRIFNLLVNYHEACWDNCPHGHCRKSSRAHYQQWIMVASVEACDASGDGDEPVPESWLYWPEDEPRRVHAKQKKQSWS